MTFSTRAFHEALRLWRQSRQVNDLCECPTCWGLSQGPIGELDGYYEADADDTYWCSALKGETPKVWR